MYGCMEEVWGMGVLRCECMGLWMYGGMNIMVYRMNVWVYEGMDV